MNNFVASAHAAPLSLSTLASTKTGPGARHALASLTVAYLEKVREG